MKRFAAAVIAALLVSSQPAGAAPKTIAASEITKVAAIAEHEGATISGLGITVFSNSEKKILVSSLDFTGTEKWKLVIEDSADQIAMAATSDKEGNTWLAGVTSAVEVVESQSATSTPINVDGVVVEPIGPSKEWIPVRNYRFDSNANSTAFTSEQTISIYDMITSGRTIQIVYSTDPVPFGSTVASNAQVFTTQTGLPESCKDLVILGATYRLLSNLDPARASMVSPQADETDSKRPYGSSQSLTKQVYALFNQRLNEEIKNQQDRYPIRVHYSL